MATIRNDIPNLTLLRLRAMYPHLFYRQDWYEDQEFANRPLETGDHIFWDLSLNADKKVPSAVACTYYFLKHIYPGDKWDKKYIWTSDVDDNGDRIYVGGYKLGRVSGFQIHRHLTIKDNWIEVGYSYEK